MFYVIRLSDNKNVRQFGGEKDAGEILRYFKN